MSFPNNIPIGGKRSIYLKLKVNSVVTANTNPILDCSGNAGVTSNGFRFSVAVADNSFNYSSQSNKGQHLTSIYTTPTTSEKVFDILITDSGKVENNATKIFIDNLNTPVVTGGRLFEDNYVTPSYGMFLGRQSNVVDGWYSNITVYEMAIFKEDLSKVSIDKTFILHDGEYKKYLPQNHYIFSDNLVPVMTSNTTPSGIAKASTEHSTSRQAYKLFDRLTGISADNWASVGSVLIGWVFYEFTKPQIVKKYKLIGLIDNSTVLKRNPKSWKFEGSNDGSTWDILDTKTNVEWSKTDYIKEFTILGNDNAYLIYRLNISQVNGATDNLSFDEWGMYSVLEVIPKGLSTVSSTLPNSAQFLSEGMDNPYPLFDRRVEKLEPRSMTDKSELLQTVEVGKVFSQTINLKKYFDIRSIRTEVR